MVNRKRKTLLLLCLLVVVWLTAGFIEAGQQTLEARLYEEPVSSMSASRTNSDCVETGGTAQSIRSGSDWLRSQQFKAGLFAVTVAGAVLLTFVVLSLKLFAAFNLSFDFCGIISYIHKKDGMK